MQGGLSLVPAVRSGHHIPAASTKTWTLHHSLPPSSAYCPLSSKDLLVFIRYLPSSKYDISTQEQTKQRGSKGTIISHYSFSYQKKKKLLERVTRKILPTWCQDTIKMCYSEGPENELLGSVMDLIFVSPQIYILKPNPQCDGI